MLLYLLYLVGLSIKGKKYFNSYKASALIFKNGAQQGCMETKGKWNWLVIVYSNLNHL